jgi:hypothetical protein
MTPHIQHPITRAEYNAHPGINHSLLKHLAQSPAHLRHAQTTPFVPTRAMQLGTVADNRLFGTECEWKVSPYKDYKTHEAQEWRDDHQARGVVIVTRAESEKTERMLSAIRNHKDAAKYLSKGMAQVGVFDERETPSGPVQTKALPDWLCNDYAMILDLKTTTDASQAVWENHVVRMGYDVQAGHYIRSAEAACSDAFRFGWIVAETEEPHGVAVYIASHELIKRGMRILDERLAVYARCLRDNDWPAYPGIREITGPRWAMRSVEEGWV